MIARAVRRLLAVAGVLALSGTSLAAQGAGVPGWSFTWTITSTMRGQPAPAGTLIFDVAIWRGVARITPRAGQPGMRALLGDAGLILVRARDSVLTVLQPARRDALVGTLGELAALGNGAGAVRLSVTNVTSTATRAGAAPPLDGVAARRVTLDQQYTMTVRVQEMQRVVQVSEQTALDLSAALDARDPAFAAFAVQFLRAIGKPREVRAALRTAEGTLPRGAPVRTRATTLTIAGSDTLRAESVGTMSALQRVSVDTSTFRVPEGYRITEVRRLLQPR